MHLVRSSAARLSFRPPALHALFAIVAIAAPAVSQVPLAAAVEARSAPGGTAVASLFAGTTVTTGATKGAEVLVTVEGWVDESRLGPKRDSFPASVRGPQTLRIRATPSFKGKILGEFRPGAGVTFLGMRSTWAHVKRSMWIASNALGRGATAAGAPGGGVKAAGKQEPDAVTPSPPPPTGSLSANRATKLFASPSGHALGVLPSGTIVQPTARDRGWVRVRVDGWVQERDFSPADSTFGAGLTAADLRADPAGVVGKLVRWEVQLLSLQIADPLRRDLAPDEPYLLARGPGSDNALLYLAVPPALLNEAKAITPLAVVIITARVRTAHSEPVGTPILDLKTITKR